ncbi:MAG: BON domain-containing protein [Pseudomonadales bacterium]|nr:BON domain-containing protein [Pseudomonadales bacterium]
MNKLIPFIVASVVVLGAPAMALGKSDAGNKQEGQAAEHDGNFSDAWLDGKVEMALLLNRYLNSFKIDTKVDNGEVTLSGDVESDIDRDLAEQITLGIDGVKSVTNDLEVNPEDVAKTDTKEQQAFFQTIEDVTLTARVKSKLMLNHNVRARDIDVDTDGAVVTLTGAVRSPQERDLAVQIAKNTDAVKDVLNKLEIQDQKVSQN